MAPFKRHLTAAAVAAKQYQPEGPSPTDKPPHPSVGAASCRDAVPTGGLRGWKPFLPDQPPHPSRRSGILPRCSTNRRLSRLEAVPPDKPPHPSRRSGILPRCSVGRGLSRLEAVPTGPAPSPIVWERHPAAMQCQPEAFAAGSRSYRTSPLTHSVGAASCRDAVSAGAFAAGSPPTGPAPSPIP